MTVPSPGGQRIVPNGPAAMYKTYEIRAPLATHWRQATCAEAGCEAFLNGWRTVVAVDSPQAAYIRADRSRSWREARLPGGLAEFTFPPGQACFDAAAHRVPLERPEIFRIRGGDWRGNPLGTPARQLSAQSWTDDFGEHQERLKTQIERG